MQNIHFMVYVFGGLVCLAVSWLYIDAWKQSRAARDAVRIAGLMLLSLSYIVTAVEVESLVVSGGLLSFVHLPVIAVVLRVVGALCYAIGVYADPLIDRPEKSKGVMVSGVLFAGSVGIGENAEIMLSGVAPILLSVVSLFYLRRSTIGLERHVRPVAWAIAVLACAEFISLHRLFGVTRNSMVYPWVAPFGPFWVMQHVLYGFGVLLLGRWVAKYLFKQFQTQLFMIFTLIILFVFLVTTLSFTGLLLVNVQKDALHQIKTNVQVLQFALRSQQAQLRSEAVMSAKHEQLVAALQDKDPVLGRTVTADMMLAKNISSLLLVDDTGVVVSRAEDNERLGDSLSEDSLVKRALLGETASSIATLSGVISPTIILRASAPVHDASGSVIGAVIIGNAIDTAFVDGLKQATGLDVSVYGGNTVSATSFIAENTVDRLIGRKETKPEVTRRVLQNKSIYTGSVVIQNDAYIGAFAPLIDIDANAVGMLFVGRQETDVLEAAGLAIQYTFGITVLLLVSSMFPAFRVAKYLVDQL